MCKLQFACISSSCTNITSTPPLTTLCKFVHSPKTQLQLPYTCSIFSTSIAVTNTFYLSSSSLPLGCKLHECRDFCLFVCFLCFILTLCQTVIRQSGRSFSSLGAGVGVLMISWEEEFPEAHTGEWVIFICVESNSWLSKVPFSLVQA